MNMNQPRASSSPRLIKGGVWILLWFLVVAGCGQTQHNTTESRPSDSSLSIPMGVRLRSLPSCSTVLTATVIIDGGRSVPLSVDCQAGTVSGTIPSLAPGNHRFDLQFIYRGFLVATATTSGEIVSGQNTPIAFAPGSLVFPDDDDDGWTNLAELIVGKEPHLSTDYPDSSNRRLSVTYTVVDSVGLPIAGAAPTGNTPSLQNTPIAFAPVVGTATSARYTNSPGHAPINR